MKLVLIITLSALTGWLLCYGALRTAEKIAHKTLAEIETVN